MVGARKEMKVELQNSNSPESLPNLTIHQENPRKKRAIGPLMEGDGDKGAFFIIIITRAPTIGNCSGLLHCIPKEKGLGHGYDGHDDDDDDSKKRGQFYAPNAHIPHPLSLSISLCRSFFFFFLVVGQCINGAVVFYQGIPTPIHRVDMQQQPEEADSIATVLSSSAYFLLHFTTSSSFPFNCAQNSLLRRHTYINSQLKSSTMHYDHES